MTSAICNAGPAIALGKLQRLDVLAAVYQEVLLPEAVYDEVVIQGGMQGEPDARRVRLFWQRQNWLILPVPEDIVHRYLTREHPQMSPLFPV